MGRRRRGVTLENEAAWVFNRMADVYDARPPYPSALLDALCELVEPIGNRVLDIGAGIGHLTLPLASRGLRVVAIEPARAMLERLRKSVVEFGLQVQTLHAAAEALPFGSAYFDLVLIADALHFIDAELAAAQVARVLRPRGILAVVTSEFTQTPFMRAVREIINELADRRPRNTGQAIRHLAALAGTRLNLPRQFLDATPVDPATLERILQSVSFVGPAMRGARFAELRRRLETVPTPPVWSRTFTLHCARRV